MPGTQSSKADLTPDSFMAQQMTPDSFMAQQPQDEGAPIPKVTTSTNPKLAAAMSAKDMPEYVGATGALAAGTMGASIAAPAVAPIRGFLAEQMAKHPIMGPTVAGYLINKAREIPGVGHLIPPGAELIPFLTGHGKAAPEEPVNPGAPEPVTPPKEVLQASSLYRGAKQVEDPAAGLGQIPVKRGSLAEQMKPQEPAAQPIQRGSLRQMVDEIGNQVGKELKASPPPNPKQPIYQRGSLANAMKGESDLPQGHTAHQSSALRSSMYDSGAKEFHARMTSGDTTYVYGDVSPEEADAFNSADSKGKAYQQIKSGHPLVAKIVNGKRMSVKPVAQ